MAKFCTKCGKPLNEGEVCSCMAAAQEDNIAQAAMGEGQANQAPQPTETMGQVNQVSQTVEQVNQPVQSTTANEALEATKDAMSNAFAVVKEVLVNPVSGTVKLAKSNAWISSVILIVIQGLITGLFTYRQMLSLITKSFGTVSKAVVSKIDFKPVETVLFVMVLSIVLSAIYAGILFLVAKIFKGQGTFITCLNIIGGRTVITIVVGLLSFVLTFVEPTVALIFGVIISSAISMVVIVMAAREIMNIEINKYVYAIMTYVAVAIIIYLVVVAKIGVPNFPVIKALGEQIGSLTSMLGGMSSLAGLF
ncbi:MAG: YIP1 family protein [Lachnospiraceae bacterium]|nr:YIP1 family protein [Lachnospiraceae bacterium]